MHVETALRGCLISERWPKSGVDVVITVLEEDDGEVLTMREGAEDIGAGLSGWGMMSVLSGCMTVASAAIADAGIDCCDLVSGGVAAIVLQPSPPNTQIGGSEDLGKEIVLDPCPSEHADILAVCVVGHLRSRDEITEIWSRGDIGGSSDEKIPGEPSFETLLERAVDAAVSSRLVLDAALREAMEYKLQTKGLAMLSSQDKNKGSS